jgi:hypothetical protein
MPSALVGRPGEDVEAVVAMLLCRRYERAARRRPSQGDMGVDVFVPVDSGRIDVYQVKRYDRTPTAPQWGKIKKSYDTLVGAVIAGHVRVRNWYLVLPLDQSSTDEKKFADLVAGGPFERCEWKGLAWLDALASEYPAVVDYYLTDGKARLEQLHHDLMTVLGTRMSAADGAGAAAIGDGLAALHRALNVHDPFYRYDFAVGNVEDRDAFVPAEPPGTLVFVVQRSDDRLCVTWHVHARCDESVRERPIPVGLRFDTEQDPTLREALGLFVDYGKPFSAPDGTAAISMDLPGGLGVSGKSGSVQISPTFEDAARRYVIRLRAMAVDGTTATAVRLAMNAPTVGKRGERLSGEHDGGAFFIECLRDFDPARMTINFSALDWANKPAVSVIGGVEFLRTVAGSRLEVAAEHGPFMPFGSVPVGAHRVEQGSQDDGGEQLLLDGVRALAALQEHTATPLLIPDQMSRGHVREWQVVARVLDGETVADPRLGKLRTELPELPAEPMDDDHAFVCIRELAVRIGEQHVVFGSEKLHISAAHVRTDPDQPAQLTVTPRPGTSWTRARTENV